MERDIKITQIKKGTSKGCFIVECGNKESVELSWDEMIGLVASLTIPLSRPCLNWLRTKKGEQGK